MHLNFSDLPTHLRRAIILALLGVTIVALGAFSLSFGAQRAWADETGLWSTRLTWMFPLLIDLFLLVAELVLVVVSGLRYSRAVPAFFMVVFAALSIGFNLLHAPPSWQIQITAAMPPLLTICVSVIAATLIKATATGLGRPLHYATGGAQPGVGVLGAMPGTITRTDPAEWREQVYWPGQIRGAVRHGAAVPEVELSPLELGRQAAAHSFPEIRQKGRSPISDGAKREAVESYLEARWNTGTLDESVTAPEVREALAAVGVSVAERTIQPILKTYKQRLRADANGTGD